MIRFKDFCWWWLGQKVGGGRCTSVVNWCGLYGGAGAQTGAGDIIIVVVVGELLLLAVAGKAAYAALVVLFITAAAATVAAAASC